MSDPWTRTHTIKLPRRNYREIEYLHELAHAVLAEQHHLLSTAFFERGTSMEAMTPLVGPLRAASDWFADDLLMQWCPEEERAEIKEHAEYVLQITNDLAAGKIEIFYLYGGGLILAQAVKYCDKAIAEIPEMFMPIVEILLSIPPEAPTVAAKRDAVNRLAALTCQQQIELTTEQDGIQVWEIRKEET
ncbi:MAG: hypothetical protein A3K30_05475 [Deltaproteobacteria bacterium RBG_13_51_10]|nr:MAG: hypothetical protein A3K30_05475 [Deltaproteobacteria bacterium RBG_13_51_10]